MNISFQIDIMLKSKNLFCEIDAPFFFIIYDTVSSGLNICEILVKKIFSLAGIDTFVPFVEENHCTAQLRKMPQKIRLLFPFLMKAMS